MLMHTYMCIYLNLNSTRLVPWKIGACRFRGVGNDAVTNRFMTA